jgi:hypothetical protein
MMAIEDLLQDLLGNPADLKSLRDALASLPPAGRPERVVMSEEARRAHGEDYMRRHAAFTGGAARIKADLLRAEAALREAEKRLQALADEEGAARSSWVSWRDSQEQIAWEQRPPLVDELIARTVEERLSLGHRIERHDIPPPDPLKGATPVAYNGPGAVGEIVDPYATSPIRFIRTVSNAESITARVKALWGLAEDIESWTRRGTYSTVADLQRLFDAAYKALPAIEPIAAVLKRDIHGRTLKSA